MPSFEYHCEESERLFGRRWEEVHSWLDEFAGQEPYGSRHRFLRHHEAGIREAVAKFGPEAEPVARRHILSDLEHEGWTRQDPFPRDADHYRKIGLW